MEPVDVVVWAVVTMVVVALALDIYRRRTLHKQVKRKQEETQKHDAAIVSVGSFISEIEWSIRAGNYIKFTVNIFGLTPDNKPHYLITVFDRNDTVLREMDSRTDVAAALLMAYACRLLSVESLGLGRHSFSYNCRDKLSLNTNG